MAARVSAAAWLRVFSFSIFGSIVWRFDGVNMRAMHIDSQAENAPHAFYFAGALPVALQARVKSLSGNFF